MSTRPKSEDRSVTRARDPGKDPRTAEALRECVELMVNGRWRTGETTRAMAAKYGVTVDAAQRWSAEASRYIARALGDHEEIRARWLAQLESVHCDARAVGDFSAAVSAIATAARVSGIDRQGGGTTVNVATTQSLVGHPEYEALKDLVRRVMAAHPESVATFRAEWDALKPSEEP